MTVLETSSAALSLRLFGPMQIRMAGHPAPAPHSRKSLWLLALLLLRHGRPVERDWLAEMLWPDADAAQAATNLRPVLSGLRRALGSERSRLQSPNPHTLCFELSGVDVDLIAFDAAISDGGAEALTRAVALYQGPLLESCAEEWVGQERESRKRDCLKALRTLAETALAAGDPATATRHYRHAVELDPWGDGTRRGLMEALTQNGDTNAALQVYRDFTQLLRNDPGAAPDQQTSALYRRLRAEADKTTHAPVRPLPGAEREPAVNGRLPHALTDLIGREDERMEVAMRLRQSRLTTLTGPGGIGKTRLAAAVANEAAREYADGVWLVALEALSDGSQVAAQIAGVLGLKEEPERPLLQSLTERLRAQRLLLVLDNCEHVLESCAQIAEGLLQECADLRILTTSREPLRITGETDWTVPSLTTPSLSHLPPGRATLLRMLMGYESVQLFVERAQGVQKGFQLTQGNALPVAQICARLEGSPLAIELAAAWVRALTVDQIATRLDNHLNLLTDGGPTPPRQQTLRATLDWSYDLLSDTERVLLRRLSVFAGGWSLEAAERVCAGASIAPSQIVDLLDSLVNKSLVTFKSHEAEAQEAPGRYRFLEMTRQYARERLAANDELDAVRSRHRDHFLELAEGAYAQWRRVDEAKWRRRLEAERDNLRAALDWSAEDKRGAQDGLRLAGALFPSWSAWNEYREGRMFLQRALIQPDAQAPTAARARALFGEAILAQRQGDDTAARSQFEQSLSIFRELGDTMQIASTLGSLGDVTHRQGDHDAARALYEEAQTLYQSTVGDFQNAENNDRNCAGLSHLGLLAFNRGDYVSASELGEQSLDLHRTLGDREGCAIELNNLGNVAWILGDHALARTRLEESIDLFRMMGDQRILFPLNNLGRLMCDRGDRASARACYEESLILCQEWGDKATSAESLEEIATTLLAQNEAAKAVRLLGASQSVRDSIGALLPSDKQEERDRQIEQSRQALGDTAFDAAWDKGRALTWEQAIAYALGDAEIDAIFTQESRAK
ncbi:hypothetical protein CCAX7_28620 [Capsulimonas corticalis]|uniref:Uncharacterized protein n=1 Tax=Capsulimonas corticalis TaxID=2219043 RepID=A0A402CT98_9BACT|nr:tetratricopeptide repeat protein [Capsulimonas corticalis]BDI30811.1 hypothetical protein CCAX7_28620 [Capsulimonas corticalis]